MEVKCGLQCSWIGLRRIFRIATHNPQCLSSRLTRRGWPIVVTAHVKVCSNEVYSN